jgi:hypothetical protein
MCWLHTLNVSRSEHVGGLCCSGFRFARFTLPLLKPVVMVPWFSPLGGLSKRMWEHAYLHGLYTLYRGSRIRPVVGVGGLERQTSWYSPRFPIRACRNLCCSGFVFARFTLPLLVVSSSWWARNDAHSTYLHLHGPFTRLSCGAAGHRRSRCAGIVHVIDPSWRPSLLF